jgi:ribosomal protein L16 Arg81 hydroxylase
MAVDPTEFAEQFWGRRPLLCRATELGQDFTDLFSLEAVDELVANRGIRTPFVRMATDGSVLDPSRFTSPGGFGAEIGDQLDSAKVLREFAGGSTLVLQALHRTWQPIAEFTRQLVAELAHPAQVNAYVTPASSRGFDAHYDVHDVFVIQIHGEKHWMIHPPVQEIPLRDQPWTDHRDAVTRRSAGPPAIDAVLRPGDVLYLPRGWIHSATALGGTSIHLTVGVAPLTRWNLVQQIVLEAAGNVDLRRALPIGFDAADAAATADLVAQTITALADQLASAAERPDHFGPALARALADSLPPEPLAPLATIESLAALDGATTVRWRTGIDATIGVDRRTAMVRIVLPTRTISLPAEAETAVRELAIGEPMTVGDLGGLDATSAVVVVNRLVREGILVLP